MKKLNIFQDFILNNYNQEEKEMFFTNRIFDEIVESCEVYNFLQSNHLEIIKK